LLLMPAWNGGGLGVKIGTVFPDNGKRGLGVVQASYLLIDRETGQLRAFIDGSELTLRRTACASALASRYLSLESAATLLMVGTGKLAPHLVAAHATVRRLERIAIWGRDRTKAEAVADDLGARPEEISVVTDLRQAIPDADVISCATLATEPLIAGDWLRPGQHLDLVGAFTPAMREADAETMRRARIVVDTYDGALSEAGDIVQAIAEGAIRQSDLAADLSELARGARPGRQSAEEITLFKSVGTALEDLAAAELLLDNSRPGMP
jgi:ornithine cyclodeaminase